ncbi:DUF3596 domain-containing protein [Idiomarina sp.]|uniref:Arm DNA-binding domain-containing protein n=1 Tax=Idiomarina sp. TaxID=1874361 RepID=UPI0025BB2D21|nr:DUF3596 domain-containing protein [Idiomarina sp.]
MARMYARKENNRLVIDFSYRGKRCREQTSLEDTRENRKRVQKLLDRIEAEITLGTFDYARHFPGSPKAQQFKEMQVRSQHLDTPLFSDFAETWFAEMRIQWRTSHADTVRRTLNGYLLPAFGDKEVGCITKADILEFRASLAKVTTRSNKQLSPSRINHIMTPLRMILNEAANRYNFSSPYQGIKSLKVPRTDVAYFGDSEQRFRSYPITC